MFNTHSASLSFPSKCSFIKSFNTLTVRQSSLSNSLKAQLIVFFQTIVRAFQNTFYIFHQLLSQIHFYLFSFILFSIIFICKLLAHVIWHDKAIVGNTFCCCFNDLIGTGFVPYNPTVLTPHTILR